MADAYKEAIDEFYTAYRNLQKYMNLRATTHFAPRTDGYIEIWTYKGSLRDVLLVKVTAEKDEENAETVCYRKAADIVKNILSEQEAHLEHRCAG